jgi:hypothetical protein
MSGMGKGMAMKIGRRNREEKIWIGEKKSPNG